METRVIRWGRRRPDDGTPTLPQLDAPLNPQAYALSSSSISVTCSSVANAIGYSLEVSLTQNGNYTEIYRGPSANYTHISLPASSPRWYRWKALAATGFRDSDYSFKTSAITQPEVDPGTRVYGEIPYNTEWAFADDVSSQELGGFTDGILNQNVELNGGGGNTQPGSVIVFPFPKQMGVEIKEVHLGDGQHDNPVGIECWTIDPVTKERVYQFNFTGQTGNGVLEKKILPSAVRTDYFLFRWGYPLPTEVKFVGWYTPYTPPVYVPEPVSMDMMAGFVTYLYDHLLPSGGGPDLVRLELSECGHFYRLYIDTSLVYVHDNNGGKVTFQPTRFGAWSVDALLHEMCEVRGMRVMICLKGNEGATWYPMVEEQFSIRYGKNKNVDPSFVRIDTSDGYGPTRNVVKIGLGYNVAMQQGNEPWRWWLGDADIEGQTNLQGNMTVRETYAYHKAGYRLIKKHNPDMEVVTGGMPSDKPGILQGMLFWAEILDNGEPFTDGVAYHKYINQNGGQNLGGRPLGVQPEANNTLYEGELRFGRVILQWSPNKPLKKYITEIGWSHATGPNSNPEQTAPPTATKDTFRVQADWVLRGGTEAAMGGSNGKAGYQLFDDANWLDNLDGGTNWDTSNGEAGQSPAGEVFHLPTSDATKQRKELLSGYFMVSSDRSDPELRVHRYAKTGAPDVVSLHMTTHADRTKPYQLAVPAGKTPVLKTFNFGVMSKVFAYVRPSEPTITFNDGNRTVSASHSQYETAQLEYMTNNDYQFKPYTGPLTVPIGQALPKDWYRFRVKRLNPSRNVGLLAGHPAFTANPGTTADVVITPTKASYDVFYDRYTPGTQTMDTQTLPVVNGFCTVTAGETPVHIVFN